jgi:hypothetical protein
MIGNPGKSLNGFDRKFIERGWHKITEFKLSQPSSGIAGADQYAIYLQTSKVSEILMLNLADNTIKAEKVAIPQTQNFVQGFQTTVLYPEVFITGANARKMIKTNLLTSDAEVFDIPTGAVLSAQIIDRENAIIRCVDTVKYQIEFRKFNFKQGITGEPVKVSQDAREDIFAHDGSLSFDRKRNMLWYTNYYSNGIMKFDTDLQNIGKYKSIDTTNLPNVSVSHLEKSIAYSKPPVTVNKQSFVYDGHLYVHSTLIADNETTFDRDVTVIDVYGPNYEGSFYVPVPSKEFRQAVMLDNNKMAVLLRDRLVVFVNK